MAAFYQLGGSCASHKKAGWCTFCEAGWRILATRLLRTGFIGSCRRYFSHVSGPDKRCHARFLRLRQKMLPSDEGRIYRLQSALEQLYQHFCANSSEAGDLLPHHVRHILIEVRVSVHLVIRALQRDFLSLQIASEACLEGRENRQHCSSPTVSYCIQR